MLKIQQIFLKLYRFLLYVVIHNLESINAGLVDVKKALNLKRRSKGIFVRENLKKKKKKKKKKNITIKNVIGCNYCRCYIGIPAYPSF